LITAAVSLKLNIQLHSPLSISSGGYRGVAMVSAETPSEKCPPHPINGWRYFQFNGSSKRI